MNGLRKDIVLTRVSKAYGGQIVLQDLDLLFMDSRESRSDPVLFKRLKDGSFVIPAVLFHIDAKRVFLHSFTIATAVL